MKKLKPLSNCKVYAELKDARKIKDNLTGGLRLELMTYSWVHRATTSRT